jgi:hypothetical protein
MSAFFAGQKDNGKDFRFRNYERGESSIYDDEAYDYYHDVGGPPGRMVDEIGHQTLLRHCGFLRNRLLTFPNFESLTLKMKAMDFKNLGWMGISSSFSKLIFVFQL